MNLSLSDDERAIVARCCAELGVPLASVGTKLVRGRSGSLVVRLTRGDTPAVLKVTSKPQLMAAAMTEMRLLSATAGQFSDVLPTLIGSAQSADSIAIVLPMYDQVAPAASLSIDEWVAIALTLSSIHRQPAPPIPGLGPRKPPNAHDVEKAMSYWEQMGAGTRAQRGAELMDSSTSGAPRPPLPTVLTHGDCHTENLVQDSSGRYRWIDWQQAHLDDGLEDLVFLWQRAEFAGASPPRQAMLTAYAAARALEPADLKPQCHRAELRLLVHSWGPYLAHGSAGGRYLMWRRLQTLTSQ